MAKTESNVSWPGAGFFIISSSRRGNMIKKITKLSEIPRWKFNLLWFLAYFVFFPILLSFWVINNMIDAFNLFKLKVVREGEILND